MNPRTKRLLIIVLALDTLVVAGVVLYFMLRR
jgi:phage shock protein PspC (stress-responsive transcriptional regulator)